MLTPSSRKAMLALGLLFLAVYVAPLGFRPLFAPDEVRYGQIPREMIQSGDWIVPRLDGFRYFEKPPLGYWIQALSLLVFGENAFAIRFPSALATGLSAWLLWLVARRFVREAVVQILAALVFLTSVEVMAIGTYGVLDSLLSFFLTAALVCFFFASASGDDRRRERRFLVLCGIACGAAFSTKGFLAFVVVAAAVGPYLVWERRTRDLLRMAWIPLCTAVLVCLPWGLWIARREPDFWHFFFWNEHVRRFMAHDAQNTRPFWFFMALLPGMALPWIFVLPAALAGARERARTEPLFRFALCWFVFPFVFFSLAKGKLITYILPCFPPLALLVAMGLADLRAPKDRRAFDVGARILAGIMAACAAIVVLVQAGAAPHGLHLVPYGATWRAVAGALAFGGFALLLVASARSKALEKKWWTLAAAPLPLIWIATTLVPDATRPEVTPGAFLRSQASHVRAETLVFSGTDPLRAVCWNFDRRDVDLFEGRGELAYGAAFEDSKKRFLRIDEFAKLVRDPARTKSVVLVAPTDHYRRAWEALLPRPVYQASSGATGYVFLEY
jgi:4-amino-4-deoxy-L-arabinose transferase